MTVALSVVSSRCSSDPFWGFWVDEVRWRRMRRQRRRLIETRVLRVMFVGALVAASNAGAGVEEVWVGMDLLERERRRRMLECA